MIQVALIEPVKPPSNPLIDLRCCDIAELSMELADHSVDVIFADPPWKYSQSGASKASDHYACLPTETILEHVSNVRRLSNRLVLWTTGPLLTDWMTRRLNPWGGPVTVGTWYKTDEDDGGHYGQGYHWAGCSELVLVYANGAYCDRSIPLRNSSHEPPGAHSRKPAEWQAGMIRRWCPPGGLVLDMYAGLGSVAEAVLLAGEGRRYVGAEIDPARRDAALSLLAQVRP